MIIKNENSKNGRFEILFLRRNSKFVTEKKFGVIKNFDDYLTTYPPQIEIVCPFTYFASWKL